MNWPCQVYSTTSLPSANPSSCVLLRTPVLNSRTDRVNEDLVCLFDVVSLGISPDALRIATDPHGFPLTRPCKAAHHAVFGLGVLMLMVLCKWDLLGASLPRSNQRSNLHFPKVIVTDVAVSGLFSNRRPNENDHLPFTDRLLFITRPF